MNLPIPKTGAAIVVLAFFMPDGSLSICIQDAGHDAPLEIALLGQWLHDSEGRVVAPGFCSLSNDDAEKMLALVCRIGSPPRIGDEPSDPVRCIADVLIAHLGELTPQKVVTRA